MAGKTSNFADLPADRRQLEARNFETARYVDKQETYLSYTISALKRYQTWGINPQGFAATYGEN